jgi:GDPmannose 4,6-dehydratase
MPRALITGISGQDGSYLAEFLVGKGYDVHGTIRPGLVDKAGMLPAFLEPLQKSVTLHNGQLEEPDKLAGLLCELECDECYHLAGPSAVDSGLLVDPVVFLTMLKSTKALLGAVANGGNRCRFFFAGSSEMIGRAPSSPQDERTPFQPRSLYGLARLAGFHAVHQFRQRTRGFACTGILYNHESPRRRPLFLPRKVSLAVARIKIGTQERLALGNLDAVRDWGYAPDFIEAMWLMLQQDEPRDFIVATGKMHRVSELVDLAFRTVGLDYRDYVNTDARFFRSVEAVPLCGDSSRIAAITGWQSKKSFDDVIAEMVAHDLAEQSAEGRSNNFDSRSRETVTNDQ